MIKKLNKMKIRTPIDIREILKKMKNEVLEIIADFITSSKIDI